MGMFDNISTSEPLPFTDEMKELGLDKNNLTYQTKDLQCLMDSYVIQNHKLYIQKYKSENWVPGNPKSRNFMDRLGHMEREKPYHEEVPYHGEIYFYEFVHNVKDKWDCWIEYKAVFTKGELTTLDLVKFEKTDNTERKQREKEWAEEIKKEFNKPINKYFLHTKPVSWFRRKTSIYLNKLGNSISALSLKV